MGREIAGGSVGVDAWETLGLGEVHLSGCEERMMVWSVSHSALCILRVSLTQFKSPFLQRTRSNWCQCFDLGWRQGTLCLSLCLKKLLVTARL